MLASPFKFLDSYTRNDREIFFGRESEIEELYHRVFESKIMLVYGISGTGKSSLINCGLANKFQDSDWLPVNIRRGGDIIESMALSIKQAAITPITNEVETPIQFKKAVRSLYLDYYKPVFFIFDQFEELFIFGNSEERKNFIQIVKTIIDSDLQCRFIFVLREEYLAGVTEFEQQIPSFLANRIRIERMTVSNARQVIEGPCKVFGVTVEDGFSDSLLDHLCPGCVEVELTYLQVYLDKVYRLATKESSNSICFKKTLLEQIGNVSDLLGSFLDEQLSLLENSSSALTVLKSFVSIKGTKRQMSIEEVEDYTQLLGKAMPNKTLQELIQTFIQLRILRDKDQSNRYELRHDALAAKIYDNITLAEKEMLELKQFIEDSYISYNRRGLLFTSDDLAFIDDRDSNLKLSAEAKKFLLKSREHKRASERTVKRLTIVSVIAFIFVLVVVSIYILNNLKENSAIQDAARSMTQFIDLKERYNVAKDAWDTYKTGATREALINVVNDILNSNDQDSAFVEMRKKYLIKYDESPENISYAECTMDNKYIVGYSSSYILVWRIKGALIKKIDLSKRHLINLRVSDDSKYIAGVSRDSVLTLWSFAGKELYSRPIAYNPMNTRQIFRFMSNGRVLTLSKQNDAELIDSIGNITKSFKHHSGSTNALDISKSEKFIATASSDKTIDIWYYNKVKGDYNLYNTLTHHRDTVWSVSFASNNVYVVSASADSSVLITDINNNIGTFGDLLLSFDYNTCIKKACYSKFTRNDRGILFQGYESVNKKKVFKNNMLIGIIGVGTDLINADDKYDFSNISDSDQSYVAYSIDSISYLKGNFNNKENYFLLFKNGILPFFSKDEKFFFTIDKKRIIFSLIAIDSINLVNIMD